MNIATLVTGHATLGTTGRPTGVYLPELAHSYEMFTEAGFHVEIASPRGGSAPVDPGSLSQEYSALLPLLQHTRSFAELEVATYDAFFVVGGHGTMWGLPTDPDLKRLLEGGWQRGKVLAAVCHGSVALLSLATDRTGMPLFAGKQVTGFSNEEEAAIGLSQVVPFLLEDALREAGVHYSSAALWQPHVVQDWVADFTSIRLRSAFVYLACILDAYSRRWVGWHLSRNEYAHDPLRLTAGDCGAASTARLDPSFRLWRAIYQS
jgi:putative intracellular protease/amidase